MLRVQVHQCLPANILAIDLQELVVGSKLCSHYTTNGLLTHNFLDFL